MIQLHCECSLGTIHTIKYLIKHYWAVIQIQLIQLCNFGSQINVLDRDAIFLDHNEKQKAQSK
jgi:hypothetical protein